MDGIVRKIELPRKARVQEFDYFSEGVGISFGGSDRGKSIPGFIFTLGILGCFAFLFQYYLSSTLDTTSPKLRFDEINDSSALNYNTTNSDFKFFLLFSDPKLKVVTATADLSNLPETGTGDGTTDTSGDTTTDTTGDETDPDARRLLSQRNLQTGQDQDAFLGFDEHKKYFTTSIKYVQTTSNMVKGKRVIKRTEFPLNFIPCKNASWFNNEQMKPFLDKNAFAKNIIAENGFCFDMDKKLNIYGNWLSTSDSTIEIKINMCVPSSVSPCDSKIWYLFQGTSQFAYLGSFSSTVDNSNKEEPFIYDYYFHDEVTLSTQMTNQVKVRYKRLEVKTDLGMLFEDVDVKSVGVIDEVAIQNINSLMFNPFESTVTVDTKHTLMNIEIRGTSKTSQYTRTYDKVFDFFGNIGGAMELVLLVATILYAYLDSKLTDNKVKKEIGRAHV